MHRRAASLLFLVLLTAAPVLADEKPYAPRIHDASDEGQKAIRRFRVPEGIQTTLWAAEPLLANPVAFCFDEQGRCYVAETFRLGKGVTDNRGHMYWLDDDLASRTVADRVAMYRKHLGKAFAGYETEHDRVKLVWDSTGKGVADKASVFADGFKSAAEGLGSGVLARKGNVYYTNIPHLWLLRDTKGAHRADVRQSLATGFGIHVAFIGHDMHGLRMGPDGRLYFSIGDRGLNVTTKEGKRLFYPDTGAVLRCEPDGSNLEVYATGLRNPQELAFDAQGNLFTVDNNSDSGDRARLVHVVEGGDSGWRTGYQYGSAFSDRGPWNAEKIWHLANADQPGYTLPPLAHIISGPSGFCFNYGATALPTRYRDHFFLCDFRGEAGNSLIASFAVRPKGASFEPVDFHTFLGGILATDCDFAPDGGFYVSDWVDGWGLTGKGRIYRFADPQSAKNPAIAQVKQLLAEGLDQRPTEELAKLLAHEDLRVRQEAQFALAERGPAALPTLTAVAQKNASPLARLHAIWGLGQRGRKGTDVVAILRPLLRDADAEVRAQTANALGDCKGTAASDLVPLLRDAEPRVRMMAALALSRPTVTVSEWRPLWDAVVALLADNADRDPYLRHAGALVLARFPGQQLLTLTTHDSPAVRLAAVVAFRHREAAVVWPFLDDAEPRVAIEAARAIHDVLPAGAGLALAERLGKPGLPEAFQIRALNAHFRLGGPENALAIARYAARADAPEKLRVEAVKMLGMWAKPPRRDRVTGLTQKLGERDGKPAIEAFKTAMGGLFTGPNAVRQEAARVAANLGIKEVGPTLFELATDANRPAEVRVGMLRALEALRDARLEQATQRALQDGEVRVRAEGRRLLAVSRPAEALPLLVKALESGATIERQEALTALATIPDAQADALLGKALDRLAAGDYPVELQLDLLEAAAKRPALKGALARYEANRSKGDDLAAFREALAGGDAAAGRRIFFTRAEVSCVRCHKAEGQGGDVGPELTGIGAKQKREYLLESLVAPNKQIAQGFETVVLTLANGTTVSGIVKAEDAKDVRLMTPEGKVVVVPRGKIDERARGKSAMPDDLVKHLSKRELRDLVEYLAGLKEPAAPK